MAWRPLLLVAVLLAASLVGWMRDISQGNDAAGAKAQGDSLITTHVVLAAGLVLITALFYAASVRAMVAHDLLRAENWPQAGQNKVTTGSVTATVALVLAALCAWASWRLPARARTFAAAATLLVLAHAGALVLHMRAMAGAGFVPSEGAAGSIYYWILGIHLLFTTGATAAVGATAAFRTEDPGPATGAALFFAWMALAWLLMFALVHLHVLPLGGQPLT